MQHWLITGMFACMKINAYLLHFWQNIQHATLSQAEDAITASCVLLYSHDRASHHSNHIVSCLQCRAASHLLR